MNGYDAGAIASVFGFRLDVDFHTLSTASVENVVRAADAHKYRAPKNANGSRARYYHARLSRAYAKRND